MWLLTTAGETVSIAVLPEHLVNRIAAGEVIERPASVVKELVENSLDAGASRISVSIEGSGSSLIRVRDDGAGMAFQDVPLAFERHSTSKIGNESDLANIGTFGFRGEALPSIAAVANVEVLSRCRDQEVGCRFRVEGGRKARPVAAAAPLGTHVDVRHLFLHVPARLKFLKSPRTELKHILDVVNRIALARPEVHFHLDHAGKNLCDYPTTSNLKIRLQQVLGDVGRETAWFSHRDGPLSCCGFTSTTPVSFGHNRLMMTYVNGRFVRDRMLAHAVLQAYDTLLMKGRFPATVLFVEVPPELVDVNVHPAKYEVRFRRQSQIYECVLRALRGVLKETARGARPLSGPMSVGMGRVAEESQSYPSGSTPAAFPGDMSVTEKTNRRANIAQEADVDRPGLFTGFFSSLDVVGQVLGCYILCQSPAEMILIDQHAAHERIAYERMRRDLEHGVVATQELLIPEVLELPAAEAATLPEHLDGLKAAGLVIEEFGPRTFAIRAVPALLGAGDYRAAVRSMAAELAATGRSREWPARLRERLMTLACHSVIRANRILQQHEMLALLRELDRIEFATQCPHGRPVMVRFGQVELARLFKRV